MKPAHAIAIGLLLALTAPAAADVDVQHRWVYISANLQVDRNADRAVELMEQAKKAGYNGILLADYKFSILGRVIPRYFTNLEKVKAAAKRLDLDLIPGIFPVGYSSGILAHDPNLAAGLPVRGAPFVVRGGRLVPDDPLSVAGDFEKTDHRGAFTGWGWQDGSVTIDRNVAHGGRASARFADIPKHAPEHGNSRICVTLDVKPFRYYHVSLWIRTKDFETPGQVKVAALAGKRSLQLQDLGVKRNQDWTQHHVAFNTLDNEKVNFYIGVWRGRGGTMWVDDVTVEPAGFVNVLRRGGCPLKLTSPDGATAYIEGRDFAKIADPKLGVTRWPGEFTVWHEPPAVAVPAGSRLKEGDRVAASYYHPAIVHRNQVGCALTEEKVYDILTDQMRRVHEAFGDSAAGYMMSHDEWRVGGWDAIADAKGWTAGQWMAHNVKRCQQIAHKVRPGVPLYVWSDMFDPHHNARENYYLVKSTLAGSWEGLDKSTTVVNWYFAPREKNLPWFAGRGHKQILAGYYDGDPTRIAKWLASADRVDGVVGVMYTTWQNKYADLAAFNRTVDRFVAEKE